MTSLLRKEFVAQWPFVILVIFIVATSYLSAGLTDSLTHRSIESLYGEGLVYLEFDLLILLSILALAVSYGLLVRDLDDRTIEFLDALPVSRRQIFFAKYIAGLAVLWLMPLLDSICMIGLRVISTTSLDRNVHLDWVFTSHVLLSLMLFTFYSVGLLLSFTRRFGWLLIGLMVLFSMMLGEWVASFQLSNWSLFANVTFDGLTWLWPWRMMGWYVAVWCTTSAAAYGLYAGAGQALLRWSGKSDSRVKQTALIATSICTVGIFVVIMALMPDEDGEIAEPNRVRVSFPSWTTATRQTEHFQAVYPTNLDRRANELLDDADQIYQTVADFLGSESDQVIQIDMSSYSTHHLGTAYWNKLKMDLTASDDAEMLRGTLGHETTHVILESLSDNRLREAFPSTRMFHEGVATYVQRRFFSDKPLMEQRLPAAVMVDRKEASFERLVDNETLRREHDSLLVYELGEVFAAAVTNRFGDAAIGDLARTFADSRHTKGLSGVTLWRSVFQASGYSLSAALDEYYGLLQEARQHHSETVEALKPIDAVIRRPAELMTWVIEQPAPDGWSWVMRFRPSETATDQDYWMMTAKKVPSVQQWYTSTSLDRFVGRSVWYQIGCQRQRGPTIFQSWQSVRK